MSSQSQKRRARQSNQQGYVLLSLLLMMAIMAIVAATMVTSLKFEIQRDREEEMIHRGVQYSRAIRAYYKKFGRYPATIENLENTNQLRFLRKRYKDPLTGKDFKLLHFGEVRMGLAGVAGMGPGVIPGARPPNGAPSPGADPNGQNPQTQTPQNTDPSQTATSTADSPTGSSSGGTSTTNSPTGSSSGGATGSDATSSDQPVLTFGGMPIIGVASTSKAPTIREFDKKKKYNEWSFVYDPSVDRGLLIKTPYQPQLQLFGTGPQNLNGPTPTPGLGTSAPGTVGNAPPPNSNNNSGNPNQPTDTPVPQ